MVAANYSINGNRLWNDLMQLGEIGRGADGGVTRTSLDEGDIAGRKFLLQLLEQSGLKPRMDAAGNIYGEVEGSEPHLPKIVIGSHIDTVRSGGRFDGAMGVLIGVEVLRTLQEKGIRPTRTVQVVSFTDEEGIRFNYAFLGSLAAAGSIPAEELRTQLAAKADADGTSYLQALWQAKQEGGHFSAINPDALDQARLRKEEVHAYLEVHIEQGKVLEDKGLGVGLVTGITGGEWWEITIKGEAGHAGTMAMAGRRDALAAASEAVLAVEAIAGKSGGSRATVGVLQVKPGSSNVIPGQVDFTLDIRDLSAERRERTAAQIAAAIRDLCEKRGVSCQLAKVQELPSVFCAPKVMAAMRAAFAEMNVPVFELPSGAAHDAMVMAGITDIGMLFVRSKNGISHNPAEWSEPADVALGCELLYRTVLRLLETEGPA
jgi:allantoate deiminase